MSMSNDNDEDLDFEEIRSKLKLVDAFPIIINSWNETSSETIINCSNHAFKNWSMIKEEEKDSHGDSGKQEIILPEKCQLNFNDEIERDLETTETLINIDDLFIKKLEENIEEHEWSEDENITAEEKPIGVAEAMYFCGKLEKIFLENSCNTGLIGMNEVKILVGKTKRKRMRLITDYIRKI